MSALGRTAAARVRAAVDKLVETARADLPKGVRVERVEGGLALIGRGLSRRSLNDARLRRIGR